MSWRRCGTPSNAAIASPMAPAGAPASVAPSDAHSTLLSMWRPGSGTSRESMQPLPRHDQPAVVIQPGLDPAAARRGDAVPGQARRGEPLGQGPAARIVVVEHDPARRRAQLGESRLDRAVRLDRPVPVEMVLADVRVERHVGAARDRRQLELRELEDRPLVGPEIGGALDERRADVPAQHVRDARAAEHGGHERGRRRLALRPGHRQDPRPGQAQEQLHLAHDLGPARLGRGERLAQPRVGGREPRRDRGAGDEQVGVREQRHRVGLVHAERQPHRPCAECGDRVRQLRGGPSVVGGDHRAGIGQEAAGGDARTGQPEDDGATAAEVVDRSDRGGGGGHHRFTGSRSRCRGRC